MSTVDSSAQNRSSTEEALQRQRDSFTTRESEEAKKHKQEVKNLVESHQKEVDAIQDSHNKQLQELKARTNDAISSHDLKYMREIDEIRDMHQKQMVRSAQEAEQKYKSQGEALRGENERILQTTEMQKDRLAKTYAGQMTERDRLIDDYANRTREAQAKSNSEVRKDLLAAKEKEVGAVVKDRDERLMEAQQNYKNMRSSKDGEISRLDRDKNSQVESLTKKFETSVMGERENNKLASELQHESFADSVNRNHDKYERAMEQHRAAMENSRNNLVNQVTDRVDHQVRSLQNTTETLKNDAARERLKMQKEKEREIADLKDEYQRTVEASEQERLDFVHDVNRRSHEAIDKVNKANQELVSGITGFYQEKGSMDNVRNQERFTSLNQNFEADKAHTEASSEARYKKLKGYADLEQAQQQSYFGNATKQMRDNFDNQLMDLRVRHKDEQNQLFSQFTKQSRSMDQQAQDKINEVTLKYETELAELKDQHQKEMRDFKSDTDRRLKEQQKKDQIEAQTQVSQLQYRIAKNDEIRKKEIVELNKKHEEALQNLTKVKPAPTNTKA